MPQHSASHARMLSQEEQKRLARIIQAGKDLLSKLLTNQAELHSLLNGLNGGYVAPQFGGDVIRDGARVLPTGRNIHAMDPWRVPSELAMQRGQQIAQKLLAAHCNSASKFPETVAQVLWGMDTIKTKGEPIAIVLALIGARPEKDAYGKISAYKLIPLSELGRPRIDVLMMASGIFRDTFAMQIDFLDRLVKDAAQADEAPEMNFIKKHVEEIIAEKHVSFEDATARIFTQRPGDYGNYVDDMIESSSWQDENELGEMFFKRNAYAYGGTKKGKLCAAVLDSLLTKVEHISQEIDSVEYGITDHQHYFAESGAMRQAVAKRTGKQVQVSYIESFTAETTVRSLESTLRMEARTKLLNPKWYETMLKHQASGAAEISSRFTYLLGWSATAKAVDKWVFDESAKTYLLDEQMRNRLMSLNPAALKNMAGRLLEAAGRGLWQADADTLAQLRDLYADLEDRLEGLVTSS